MDIYKQPKSPYFYYDFVVNGTRYRKSTRQITKKAATEVAYAEKQRLEGLQVEIDQTGKAITLADAFDAVMDHKSDASKATHTAYRLTKQKLTTGHVVRNGVVMDCYKFPDGICLHEITSALLAKLKAERLKEGLKPASVNMEMRILRAVMNYHDRNGRLVNTKIEIPQIKLPTKERYFTKDEEKQIIAHLVKDPHNPNRVQAAYLFQVLMDTGMRKGEAKILRWENINFDDNKIVFFRPKTKTTSAVPLSNRVAIILGGMKQATGLVFSSFDAVADQLRIAIEKVCNTSGHEVTATTHTTRHTYISRLVDARLPLPMVQKLAGHTSIQTTMRYTHTKDAEMLAAASIILNSA